MEATRSSQELAQTLGRGWTLFNNYFPKYYSSFHKDFLAATQISVEQYFIIFAMMITHYMDPTRNSGIFSIQDTLRDHKNARDLFRKYIELESQSTEEIKREIKREIKQYERTHPIGSYHSLRVKPILCTDDGRGIIIDPVFFAEKGSIGPLFHILKSPTCHHPIVFTAFGQAFEEYILDILSRMFSSSTNLANKFSKNIETADSKGKSIEVDGMLNDVFQTVLFEVKAGFIPEQAILSDDHESLLQTMRERYSITQTKKGKTKLKGVGQLARAAVSIAQGRWKENNEELQSVRTVYPVLIVHDDLLTSPVYGDFFVSEFSDRLQECSSDNKSTSEDGNITITPVITLSVSDLEYLEVAIEHFRFCDLLADYSEACPDRLMSLYNFIAASDKYKFYYNRNLASKGLEVFDKCKEFLFDKKH
ncbi:MAG: hypothetical protein GY795_14580 [Desulfobacterales bacterium]|nr:hypothetical protein [Desulfobacterales bacterium]